MVSFLGAGALLGGLRGPLSVAQLAAGRGGVRQLIGPLPIYFHPTVASRRKSQLLGSQQGEPQGH